MTESGANPQDGWARIEHERSGVVKTVERVTEGGPGRIAAHDVMAAIGKLAADLEQLLDATAGQTGQRFAQVRGRAEESLQAAKVHMADLRDTALATSCAPGRATHQWVRANTWPLIGIGAVAGLALGWVVARDGRSPTESR